MTDAINWNEIIDAARAQNSAGIQMRGSKKYTPVSVRMEIARRYLGAGFGVYTEIITCGQQKGDPVVVKATITGIPGGAVLATGHAEEIRGAGNVNQTSALENAETSAIGRALAALGLSGGEFASANELDAVERKREAQKASEAPQEQHPIRDAWEQGIWDSLPQDATEKDFWRNAHKQLRKEFSEYKSLRGLMGAFEKYGSILNRFEKFDAAAFDSLCRYFQECQEALENAPKPQVLTKAAGEAILAGISARDTLAELETYMHALRNGPNAFAADHPKIKAGYEEHRAAILEANPAEAKQPGPLDFFAQG